MGAESYAERITGTAREFRHPRSPLERSIDRLLYVLLGVMIPLGAMLIVALVKQDVGMRHAVDTAVAGMVTLIPEGLILLLSVTYAAAALRMARAGALSQQLNAIESLASVDTLCIDKTGTLTTPSLRVLELVPAAGTTTTGSRRRSAASRPRSSRGTRPSPRSRRRTRGPPSRETRSSRSPPGDGGAAGAAEVFGTCSARPSCSRSRTWRPSRPRSATTGGACSGSGPRRGRSRRTGTARCPRSDPLGLVVLAEELRPEARSTVGFLVEQEIEIVVLSGDAPDTVASIASDAGIPSTGPPLEGDGLPAGDAELAALAPSLSVVGRISPEGKRRVVESLRRNGRYVAMVGDGVNDVPALKASRLSVAQGSGTQMAKAVADIVLVTGDFASIPTMVAEGRRILRNIQRVTKLFVTKSVFAAFVIVAVGITPADYPLLPRHLTIVGALTVGIPAFFLALAPSDGPWRTDGFLREVGRFAVPAGVAAGLGVTTTYLIAVNVFDLGLLQSQDRGDLDARRDRPLPRARPRGDEHAAGAARGHPLRLPPAGIPRRPRAAGTRRFFELAVPNAAAVILILVGSGIAIGFLWLTDDRFVPLRHRAG